MNTSIGFLHKGLSYCIDRDDQDPNKFILVEFNGPRLPHGSISSSMTIECQWEPETGTIVHMGYLPPELFSAMATKFLQLRNPQI